VVFFAFVFHELATGIAARRYGFQAVYHVWIPGLVMAMGASARFPAAALAVFIFDRAKYGGTYRAKWEKRA